MKKNLKIRPEKMLHNDQIYLFKLNYNFSIQKIKLKIIKIIQKIFFTK